MKFRPEQISEEKSVISRLSDKVDELSQNMERMRLAEYVEMMGNRRRLLYINFLIGLARGFGTAIGFTILAALVLYILQKVILLNIPVMGEFIADLVTIVQAQLQVR
ncbi:MAG: DUF5665 domain-containing protein [Syntrophomonadaceae bacterium]|nr:DUF5665 domain-containing protein [Syntrophomonadaceae bacterium]MDD3888994.1 DUF5665 domain-containing protein [Syntrophomonadaceae bacterium]MDD4549730.1 DUF5665 domain-containing protein [Syntrophomonadaceae bacterium]